MDENVTESHDVQVEVRQSLQRDRSGVRSRQSASADRPQFAVGDDENHENQTLYSASS